jgi:predicted RNA-binding protein YlqC (UPF0109 family)
VFTALATATGAADAAPARGRQPNPELRLVFLDAGEGPPIRQGATDAASVDLGRVVARSCGARLCPRTVVTKRFRLRVEGAAATRFVRVSAFVRDDAFGQVVRIDGRLVTALPQVIGAATPLNVAVAHTVEIEVSATAPEGALSHDIVWQVEDFR